MVYDPDILAIMDFEILLEIQGIGPAETPGEVFWPKAPYKGIFG